MAHYSVGRLTSAAASGRPDLLAAPVLAALTEVGLLDEVGIVEIDPDVSDTAATQEEFALPGEALANCVVVSGRREGMERVAGCVILATTRADVNGAVRRRLDVRKASFLPMDRAVADTGMEYGGITPIGLPDAWPVLVDRRILEQPVVIIGSGVRRSKLLLPGTLFERLPGVEIVDGLATPMAE